MKTRRAPRRKEFAARTWSKLVAFEKRHALLPDGGRILAAVSGGPDSVCLAHWLSVQARRKGLTVRLLHVHHGLRGREADRDAAFVTKLGRTLGLPAASRWSPPDISSTTRRRRSCSISCAAPAWKGSAAWRRAGRSLQESR